MGDVIELGARDPEYDGMTCSCGSAWFTVQAVAIGPDGHVTGFVAPLICRDCGLVFKSGAWVRPDLTEVGDPTDPADLRVPPFERVSHIDFEERSNDPHALTCELGMTGAGRCSCWKSRVVFPPGEGT